MSTAPPPVKQRTPQPKGNGRPALEPTAKPAKPAKPASAERKSQSPIQGLEPMGASRA